MIFFTIYDGFSKFQPNFQKDPVQHYSYESMTMQKTPLNLFLLLCGVPGRDVKQRSMGNGGSGDWGCLSAARKGWRSTRDMRATCGWARLELGWPEEGLRREQYPDGCDGSAPASSGEGGR